MSRCRTAGGALAGLLVLAGCGGGGAAAAPPGPSSPAPVAGTAAGVRLAVDGFHVFPAEPGDPAAQAAATALGVPVAAVGQMHLVLTLTNTSSTARSVAADQVTLRLGGHELPAVTADVFPAEPLQPGEHRETAVGFDVAATAGADGPALRWTHDGTVTVIPVGTAPELS